MSNRLPPEGSWRRMGAASRATYMLRRSRISDALFPGDDDQLKAKRVEQFPEVHQFRYSQRWSLEQRRFLSARLDHILKGEGEKPIILFFGGIFKSRTEIGGGLLLVTKALQKAVLVWLGKRMFSLTIGF